MVTKKTAWLIYMHTPNTKDLKHGERALKKMKDNFNEQGGAYVIHFGSTVKSDSTLTFITKHGTTLIKTLKNPNGIDDAIKNLTIFSSLLQGLNGINETIKAVCFWCHGAGYGCSPWKKWKRPLLQINDAIRLLIEPFHVPLVCFDACFQGSMSCLYELPKNVVATIAPPAFHPFVSVMWTRAFGRLNEMGISRNSILSYAHKINCEWQKYSKAKWKCMLVFDMQYINDIGKLVANNFALLHFDKISQVDAEDANLHDLFAAARHIPQLQNLIVRSILPSCNGCLNECNSRVRGMSMEAHLPRKWLEAYTSTQWYSCIVRNKKGFEDRRLQNFARK
jgi:hypothetical protein